VTAAALKTRKLSPQEYLEGERHSEIRHEYIDGEVYAMAGESKAHNTITGNIYMALRGELRGSPCRVFMEGVKARVQTLRSDRFYYPDVMVTCGAAGETDPYFETRPRVIVEVLSDSTERLDRADKFHAYRRLESLEEYVLVAQDTRRVEVFRRRSGWEWELYTEETPEVRLESIDLALALATVYEDAEPPASPPAERSEG
jgi:Uma2 family endonuclease